MAEPEPEIVEAGETEEFPQEEPQFVLTDKQIEKKQFLLDNMASFDNKVAGTDYEADAVFTSAATREEAEAIADAYGITLSSYIYDIAYFKLPEDISVADIIHMAADPGNDLPPVSPNYYGIADTSFVDQGESIIDDDMSLASDVVDKNFDDPGLKERDTNYQWHHDVIGSPYAWAAKPDPIMGMYEDIHGATRNVKVAVLSSGFAGHNDIRPDKIEYSKNYVSGELPDDMHDNIGDGTFITGLIASDINNSDSGSGVSPEVSLVEIKVKDLDSSGNLVCNMTDVIYAIWDAVYYQDANHKGIDIMVLDVFFDEYSADMQDKIESAKTAGISVFAPAPNNAEQTEVWPASYNYVISVGATNRANVRAGFSGYNKNIDIAAPGEDIYSASYLDPAKMIKRSGTQAACAIAAGEAALILSRRDKIDTFFIRESGIYCYFESPLIVELLEKHLKKSTISAGAGTGSGIVYLPKALGLSSINTKPDAPKIVFDGINDTYNTMKIHFETPFYDTNIFYTTNGKNPAVSNGEPGMDTFVYSEGMPDIEIPLESFPSGIATIKAMVVNPRGVSGKITTMTENLRPDILISGPDKDLPTKVVSGKTVKFSAIWKQTKGTATGLKWHVKRGDSEAQAKMDGVTVSNGTLKVSKGIPGGGYYKYKVWAESPYRISNEVEVTVVNNSVKSIKAVRKNVKVNKYSSAIYVPLLGAANCIEAILTDGSSAAETDVYYTSSNTNVGIIVNYGGVKSVFCNKPGKTTITAFAADGSGIKASFTFEVVQNATTLEIEPYYSVLVTKGKSFPIRIKIDGVPDDFKKVKEWKIYNGMGTLITDKSVKVAGGKVSTTKNTALGEYKICGVIQNPDGSTIGNSPYMSFWVYDNAVTKMVPDVSSTTLFTAKNDWFSKTSFVLEATVTGGERDGSDKLDPNMFRCRTDSPLLTCNPTAVTALPGGKLQATFTTSGKGIGNAKAYIYAVDGTGKEAVCKVKIVNPVSYINIAPAKAGTAMAVTAGKSLKLKATLGTEYGPISNKNVEWRATVDSYMSITPSGEVKAKPQTPHGHTIMVYAYSKDGSNVQSFLPVTAYRDIGKLSLVNMTDDPIKSLSVVEGFSETFIAKALKDAAPVQLEGKDFLVSTAKTDIGSIRFVKTEESGDYFYYTFKVYAYKKGSTKLTIKTIDGSQSATINLNVLR